MALSNLQRAARMPRRTERFTTTETLILNALRNGDKTLQDLISEYCRGRKDGGPVTADRCIRQIIYNLRRKGAVIRHQAVYSLEGIN